ncbi:uncharacterized protein A4U43_C04F29350 [Asparagus officinalis]|uniref:Uncharacterized protein n=1 Tax=Asparagus officinalis TaxID=4686 RepID=A0A5P1F4I1_ASPOF|nr:uncharacterized protein A4U43_C04F29350 [Asparagus officinalis]
MNITRKMLNYANGVPNVGVARSSKEEGSKFDTIGYNDRTFQVYDIWDHIFGKGILMRPHHDQEIKTDSRDSSESMPGAANLGEKGTTIGVYLLTEVLVIGEFSIPGYYEAFWKELDGVKQIWKNRKELK